MGREKIDEKDLVFFVLVNKKKFPAEKLEKEVLRATKDFGIPKTHSHQMFIREIVDQMMYAGLLNEITERSGKDSSKYYSLTENGKKAYKLRYKDIMKKGDDALLGRIDEYFQYIIYEK